MFIRVFTGFTSIPIAVKKAKKSPALITNWVEERNTTKAKQNPISTLTIEVLSAEETSTLNRCCRSILTILKNLLLSLFWAL